MNQITATKRLLERGGRICFAPWSRSNNLIVLTRSEELTDLQLSKEELDEMINKDEIEFESSTEEGCHTLEGPVDCYIAVSR